MLSGHAHEEESGQGCHCLAITIYWVKHGVGLEYSEQLCLANPFIGATKHLVGGEVSVQVFLNVIDPFLITPLILKKGKHWFYFEAYSCLNPLLLSMKQRNQNKDV